MPGLTQEDNTVGVEDTSMHDAPVDGEEAPAMSVDEEEEEPEMQRVRIVSRELPLLCPPLL